MNTGAENVDGVRSQEPLKGCSQRQRITQNLVAG